MKTLTISLLKENLIRLRQQEFTANELIAHAAVNEKSVVAMNRENAIGFKKAAESIEFIISEVTGEDVLEISKRIFEKCPFCGGHESTGYDPIHRKKCLECHGAGIDYTHVKELNHE